MIGWTDPDWTAEALVGGHPALDFLNTAGGPTKARDAERLVDYEAALRWGTVAGVLTADDAAALAQRAGAAPRAAVDALHRLRAFREALHACLLAEQAGVAWPGDPAGHVQGLIRATRGAADLTKADGGLRWTVGVGRAGLSLPLARLALAADDLLTGGDMARMRGCERCSWLFIDRGRGRPRRWCSMAACGSRAKSARYYRRHKRGPAPADG